MKIKNVYVIAGPNGSGKTAFAKKQDINLTVEEQTWLKGTLVSD